MKQNLTKLLKYKFIFLLLIFTYSCKDNNISNEAFEDILYDIHRLKGIIRVIKTDSLKQSETLDSAWFNYIKEKHNIKLPDFLKKLDELSKNTPNKLFDIINRIEKKITTEIDSIKSKNTVK